MQQEVGPFRDADQLGPDGLAAGPAAGRVRVLRAVVLTSTCLMLGIGAHIAGGGRVPPIAATALLFLATFAVAGAATRIQLRLPVVLGLLGAGQWLLHQALTTFAMAAPDLTVHAHHASMSMHAAPQTSAADMAMSTSPTMLASHVLATLATGWLLARGEAALWRVVDRLVPTRPGRRTRPARARQVTVSFSQRLDHQTVAWTMPARGPPLWHS